MSFSQKIAQSLSRVNYTLFFILTLIGIAIYFYGKKISKNAISEIDQQITYHQEKINLINNPNPANPRNSLYKHLKESEKQEVIEEFERTIKYLKKERAKFTD